MKKLLAVLVAFGLVTTVNVAASGQSEPFISECHNLDDNQVPEGWTQELWYGGPGVYDGALRAFPNDGLGKLWKQGVLPDGAVGIRFEYDANIAYSYWGIINQIFIKLSSGVAYLVRSEMSDIHNGMVTSAKIIRFDGGSEVPDTTYQWDYPFETASYHYTVTFYDGSIEYKAEKLGDGSILFDLSVEDPYLDISAIDTIAFMVRAKTDNKAWMDNLCVEIIGGEMICDEFNGPFIDNSIWTVATGTWSQSGGQLIGEWPIGNANWDTGNILLDDSVQPTGDYVFSVDMVVAPGGRPNNSTKIVLRHAFRSKYTLSFYGSVGDYVLGVSIDGWGRYHIIPDTPTPYMNTTPGDINHVKLARSGDQYCVYLNDHFLYSFEDEHFGGDVKLGLGAYGSATYERACIEYHDHLSPCDGEEICDAFLTPQRLAIHNTVMGLPKIAPRAEDTRNRNRHSFKIHLLPCEPMDVSVGDSAEVYVDVDESGEFDDDEQYPAVVSSTDRDGKATDIAIKVFVEDDLIDNDPLVAIDAVGGSMIVDADGNRIDYLQLDTFTPGDGGLMAGEELVPTAFELHQNYPNPFNPATEIRFSLSEAAEARLEVYNILGEKIAVLMDEWLAAGAHVVHWNAEDTRGQSVGSGIYFYRLTVHDWAETRKMVLLR